MKTANFICTQTRATLVSLNNCIAIFKFFISSEVQASWSHGLVKLVVERNRFAVIVPISFDVLWNSFLFVVPFDCVVISFTFQSEEVDHGSITGSNASADGTAEDESANHSGVFMAYAGIHPPLPGLPDDTGWVGDSGLPSFDGPEQVLKYLGQYTRIRRSESWWLLRYHQPRKTGSGRRTPIEHKSLINLINKRSFNEICGYDIRQEKLQFVNHRSADHRSTGGLGAKPWYYPHRAASHNWIVSIIAQPVRFVIG